jgi:hypothetical protein
MNVIFKILSKSLPFEYIEKLEQEYNEIKNSYFVEDKTKIGIHSGRFSELVSSLLCFHELNKAEDLNKINFDTNIQMLINSSKSNANEEITRLLIPRTLRTIYTIRSKKKIAHIKDFNPQKIDLKFINTAVDWVLSQLILIYSNIRNDEIINFLETVSYEDYKNVERFENGEIIFSDPKMSLSNKILFVLLDKYNEHRIKRDEIYTILKPKDRSYISTYVNNLKKQNLVHENDYGIKLTKWGINKARIILKKLNK